MNLSIDARAVRGACTPGSFTGDVPDYNAIVHLTAGRLTAIGDGTLRALCGRSVDHRPVGTLLTYRPCRECTRRARDQRLDIVVLEVRPIEYERVCPVHGVVWSGHRSDISEVAYVCTRDRCTHYAHLREVRT